MPQALGSLIISAALTATGSKLADSVLSLGLSLAFQSLLGPKKLKPSDGQIEVRTNVGSRVRRYGKGMAAGQLTFKDSRNGTLGAVFTLSHGEINAITEHRINGEAVTVDPGTGVVSGFDGKLKLHVRLGTASQTAISEFTSVFSEWTSDHRQRGCAHVALIAEPVKAKNFQAVYKGREPEWMGVWEGVKVYDPRTDTTVWSDNAALVIADFVAHADGFNRGSAGINWDNIAAEADICDQMVAGEGGSAKRWRLWGSVALADVERKTVLADMLKACDGFAWDGADGKFNLRVGQWIAPTLTITDEHVLAVDAQPGPFGPEEAAAVKTLYTEAEADYGEQEANIWPPDAASDDVAERLEAFWCPDHNQAVRLGKLLAVERLPDRWRVSLVCNLYGLNAIGERFVQLVLPDLGIDAPFKLRALRFDLTSNRVLMDLIEVASTDWALDEGEEGTLPVVDAPATITPVVPVPTGLAVTDELVAVTDVSTAVVLRVTWSAPPREDLLHVVEIKAAGGDWIAIPVNEDDRVALSPPVETGTAYDVRIKAVNIAGRSSNWSATVSITPDAGTQPLDPRYEPAGAVVPADVQTFTASGTWTKPADVKTVTVLLIGGGGGGGSGRKGAAASVRCGGGGGASGVMAEWTFNAADLPATVAVTVGTGGPGGAAQATNSTNGNNGTAGGTSSFGTLFQALGGARGNGGSATAGAGGAVSVGMYGNAAGGTASTSGGAGVAGARATIAGGGGGSGGGITSANAQSAGGAGGGDASYISGTAATGGGGAGGATGGGAGGSIADRATTDLRSGAGGGGGGSNLTGAGGAGGAGQFPGGGGGGGGAAVDATGNSGAGGAGAGGMVVVTSYF